MYYIFNPVSHTQQFRNSSSWYHFDGLVVANVDGTYAVADNYSADDIDDDEMMIIIFVG